LGSYMVCVALWHLLLWLVLLRRDWFEPRTDAAPPLSGIVVRYLKRSASNRSEQTKSLAQGRVQYREMRWARALSMHLHGQFCFGRCGANIMLCCCNSASFSVSARFLEFAGANPAAQINTSASQPQKAAVLSEGANLNGLVLV
jgi:hypothetical protein